MFFTCTPDNQLRPRQFLRPRIWTCATCHTEGQLTYRASGWAVLCPCPACPAPALPEAHGNPTVRAAIRHWNWLQGGPK